MASRSWLLPKDIQLYKSLRKHFPGDATGSFHVLLNKKSWSSWIISRWAYSAPEHKRMVKVKKKKKAQLELYKARGDETHLLYTGYGYKPSLPTDSLSKNINYYLVVMYRCREYSFQRQQWCLYLLRISSFLVCLVNQAVKYFQLVTRHPTFFEIHKWPLPASKRQQPYAKLKASGCQSTIIHLL